METLAGFPFWQLEFDGEGALAKPQEAAQHLIEIAGQSLTDLIIFSHGWNNDHTYARRLYERFFTSARDALTAAGGPRRDSSIGVVGVFWPSILFPDDEPS